MSSMTLEQLRSTLDEWGCSSLGQTQMSTELLRKMRDAIDARIAGMGESVAHVCEAPYSGKDVCWHKDVPLGTRLYIAPPIDIAAVREVIADLRHEAVLLAHDLDSQTYLLDQAGKLEAAIKGVV